MTGISKGAEIGRIKHYFGKIGVGVVELTGDLHVGDEIVIAGHGREFEQKVDSMQIEHKQIREAHAGQSVGMKVDEPVKEGDIVYLKA